MANSLSLIDGTAVVAPKVEATGDETNIDIHLDPKGTGKVVLPSGNQTRPGVSFLGDDDTGLSSSSNGVIDLVSNGLPNFQVKGVPNAANYLTVAGNVIGYGNAPTISSAGTDSNIDIYLKCKGQGGIQVRTGSLQNLAFKFEGDPDTGFYRPGTNSFSIVAGGDKVVQYNAAAGQSGVNYLNFFPAVTNAPVVLTPEGSDTDIALRLDGKGSGSVNALLTPVTYTDNQTLIALDAGRYVLMNKTSGMDLTVPPNSSVPFPVGTGIWVRGIGAGAVTIVEGSGVTVTAVNGLTLPAQYATGYLYKSGTGTWELAVFEGSSGGGSGGINAIVDKTASYTPVIGEANAYVRMNSASATTFTVPPNSAVAYPIKTELHVRMVGTGQVTIAAGSGVTINNSPDLTL